VWSAAIGTPLFAITVIRLAMGAASFRRMELRVEVASSVEAAVSTIQRTNTISAQRPTTCTTMAALNVVF